MLIVLCGITYSCNWISDLIRFFFLSAVTVTFHLWWNGSLKTVCITCWLCSGLLMQHSGILETLKRSFSQLSLKTAWSIIMWLHCSLHPVWIIVFPNLPPFFKFVVVEVRSFILYKKAICTCVHSPHFCQKCPHYTLLYRWGTVRIFMNYCAFGWSAIPDYWNTCAAITEITWLTGSLTLAK